jgi:hypothetical protein
MRKSTFLALACLLLAQQALLHAAEPANLRGEYRTDQIGLDGAQPRLS